MLRAVKRAGSLTLLKQEALPHPWWLWPNVLSLDAPLVAIIWQEGFAQSLGVELEWLHRCILGLCVWLVYCGDRILDGWRLVVPVQSARHEFARVHWRPLSFAFGVGFLSAVYFALELPPSELIGGLGLLLLVGIYFGLHHHSATRQRVGCFKEWMAGSGFAVGTVFFVLLQAEISIGLIILCTSWAGLCSVNCLMIAGWDKDNDEMMNHPSLARRWVEMESFIPWILVSIMLLVMGAAWLDQRCLMLTAALWISAIGLLELARNRETMSGPLRRVLADGVLLSPIIFLV